MKRVLLLCCVVLFAWAGAASAQQEPVEQEIQGIDLSEHGEEGYIFM